MSEADFQRIALGEIAYLEMGQSPDSRYVFDDPFVGYPFLQGNAEFGAVFPEPEFGCTKPAKMCRTGDVLISVRAPVGAVNIANRDYCIGRGLAAIRAPNIKSSLMGELIARQSSELRRVAQGTTFEAINKKDLHSLVLNIPPNDDLPVVAQILDVLDAAIAQTEAIIAKLKAVKQGLLHDLLTRGIDVNGELRPPQSEAPQLYKQSALGWIPKEWEVGTVASMTEILDSQRVPVNEVERMKRPGIVPYYGANGQQGWIDRPLFNEPLILLAEDGGNFDDFTWRPIAYRIDGESWVNNHAHVLRSKPESNQGFIFFALEHRDIRKYISGGTRTKLTAGELKTIELQNPRVDEQVAIASRLEAVVQRVGMETAMREKLLKEKCGLMDDLLTGNVRVTPLLEAAAA